ncbi:MAG: hypothetical protein QF719_10295 [Chloroflexota bacterium]|jgi:hypothetical protein|nr:hypothetical protein [Chloroflexota bacterium]MDP6509556.1 hypothetical protein [Chloroflexota bacterium]MDP6758569.1 hypothetical protein [Chloroflexota bacterium]
MIDYLRFLHLFFAFTLLAGVGIRDNPRLPAAAGVLLLLTVFLLVDVDMVFKPF